MQIDDQLPHRDPRPEASGDPQLSRAEAPESICGGDNPHDPSPETVRNESVEPKTPNYGHCEATWADKRSHAKVLQIGKVEAHGNSEQLIVLTTDGVLIMGSASATGGSRQFLGICDRATVREVTAHWHPGTRQT
ncbi:hypothetical protein AU210_016327 [Fusarium oxysporum f. sp. radicis-cucumerinum]|uniref:Uncharacterized protein n=1 Tax=Fusarium oxysporum f. sp. radicis-cucumerinum TaxID=327505 RepID=A0A2H3GAF7_FUSOX|nr:hypothetical protein AU210_016327 [Fusarium oxysporum f. sp. radicis-cucumerinum]